MAALEQLAGEVEDLFSVSCRFECDRAGPARRRGRGHASLPHRAGSREQCHQARPCRADRDRPGDARTTTGRLPIEDDGVGIAGVGVRASRAWACTSWAIAPTMIGGSLEVRRAGRAAAPIVTVVSRCGHASESDRRAIASRRPRRRRASTACCVVDDHPIVRQGLALLINREPDLVVCGEAEEAQSARSRRLRRSGPTCVILDISLDGPDGIELLKTASRRATPTCRCSILSMHDESIYAERALRAGANGYIMKQEATEQVLMAIRRILAGEVYVSERVASRHAAAVSCAAAIRPAIADREPERSRARGVPADRRGQRHAPDRRRRCT